MNPTAGRHSALDRARALRNDTLYLNIACPSAPNQSSGNKHTISIRYGTDWAVETPHDLETERIAAALGGYCACLALIDKTIPAIHANFDHLTRRADVTMYKNRRGQIHLLRTQTKRSCCSEWPFYDVVDASRHLRSAEHIANYNDAPLWQVKRVANAIEEVVTPIFTTFDDVARRMHDRKLVSELWRAGIHPESAREYLDLIPEVTEPVPLQFFLGVAYSGLSKHWLREVARIRPDASTATWLAWVPESARQASIPEWKAWLQYGLSTNDTELAIVERITSQKVKAVAQVAKWEPARAATALTSWAKAGCSPTVAHMRVLAQSGRTNVVVTHREIDQLRKRVAEDTSIDLSELQRTELGILLALLGHPDAVITALRQGIYSVHHLEPTESEQ